MSRFFGLLLARARGHSSIRILHLLEGRGISSAVPLCFAVLLLLLLTALC